MEAEAELFEENGETCFFATCYEKQAHSVGRTLSADEPWIREVCWLDLSAVSTDKRVSKVLNYIRISNCVTGHGRLCSPKALFRVAAFLWGAG